MIKPAKAFHPRRAAVTALHRSLERHTPIQAALDSIAPPRDARTETDLISRDLGLCAELLYGTVRHLGRLDAVLRSLLTKPEALPDGAKTILLPGLYELLFLDKSPDYAVVNEYVDLMKTRFGKGLGGLTNAVLRSAARNRDVYGRKEWYLDNVPGVAPDRTAPGRAAWWSAPVWLVEQIDTWMGEQAADVFFASTLTRPLQGLRINTRKAEPSLFNSLRTVTGAESVDDRFVAVPHGAAPAGLIDNAHREGRLSMQSPGAYALLARFTKHLEAPLWDCCAGSGGKSIPLLETGFGDIWASDRDRRKLVRFRKELSRLGLEETALFQASGEAPPFKSAPACTLIDAPCDGLGVLSSRPDAKWKRSMGDMAALRSLQERLLKAACLATQPGSGVVYMTCTINPHMNGELVRSMLRESLLSG